MRTCPASYIGDGKGLEFCKGHSPLVPGAHQEPPQYTYSQHICQVQQALTAPGAL